MRNGICIYCSPNKPTDKPYNREHVLPESFGKFKNNLVLNDCVCIGCNDYFGQSIDRILARGSLEAIARLDYKIKSAEDSNELLKNRIKLTLATNDRFNGLILEFGVYESELAVTLIPQVGFLNTNDESWTYISEYEISNTSIPLPENIDKNKLLIFFNSEEMKQRLIKKLSDRGITYTDEFEENHLPIIEGGEIPVELKATVDKMVFRCIAKISFNYLAHIMGIDFVIQDMFNPIREFIRWGKDPNYKIIEVLDEPILHYDRPKYRQTNGHILTAEWGNKNNAIIGKVSLFNNVTYKIFLIPKFNGVWRPIRSGHHYDIDIFEVNPLLGLSKQYL